MPERKRSFQVNKEQEDNRGRCHSLSRCRRDCWCCAEQHLVLLLAGRPASLRPSSSAELRSKWPHTPAGAAASADRTDPSPILSVKDGSPPPIAGRPAGSLTFLVLSRAHPSKANKQTIKAYRMKGNTGSGSLRRLARIVQLQQLNTFTL